MTAIRHRVFITLYPCCCRSPLTAILTNMRSFETQQALDNAPCCGTMMNKSTFLPHRSALPYAFLRHLSISQGDVIYASHK